MTTAINILNPSDFDDFDDHHKHDILARMVIMITMIKIILIRIAKLLEVAPGGESDDWGEDISTDHNLYQVNDDDDLYMIGVGFE